MFSLKKYGYLKWHANSEKSFSGLDNMETEKHKLKSKRLWSLKWCIMEAASTVYLKLSFNSHKDMQNKNKGQLSIARDFL